MKGFVFQKIAFITPLFALVCMLLTSCKNEADILQTLNELKKELAQTNDSLIGYSLKEDYAMWIHEDKHMDKDKDSNPGMQTLYKCTLSDGERTKLFTTGKDSVRLLIYDSKHVTIDRITDWKFTPDSLTLIFEDGWNGKYYFTYMIPINKTFKGVYDMGVDGIPEIIDCDSIPVYVTNDLIVTKDIDGYGDILWQYTRKYSISSNGDKKIPNDYATIYPTTANTGFEEVKVKTSTIDTREDIKNKFFEEITISVSNLEEIAKNQVKFEKAFNEKRRAFDFKVESVTYYDDWFSDRRIYKLKVKSDDFHESLTVKTTDKNAANLDVPARVIIEAYVKFHRNTFTDEPTFKFENAKIIYSEPIKEKQ